MVQIHKKLVIDEQGNPHEVIIPWSEFQEIAEILGRHIQGLSATLGFKDFIGSFEVKTFSGSIV